MTEKVIFKKIDINIIRENVALNETDLERFYKRKKKNIDETVSNLEEWKPDSGKDIFIVKESSEKEIGAFVILVLEKIIEKGFNVIVARPANHNGDVNGMLQHLPEKPFAFIQLEGDKGHAREKDQFSRKLLNRVWSGTKEGTIANIPILVGSSRVPDNYKFAKKNAAENDIKFGSVHNQVLPVIAFLLFSIAFFRSVLTHFIEALYFLKGVPHLSSLESFVHYGLPKGSTYLQLSFPHNFFFFLYIAFLALILLSWKKVSRKGYALLVASLAFFVIANFVIVYYQALLLQHLFHSSETYIALIDIQNVLLIMSYGLAVIPFVSAKLKILALASSIAWSINALVNSGTFLAAFFDNATVKLNLYTDLNPFFLVRAVISLIFAVLGTYIIQSRVIASLLVKVE